MNIKFFIEGEPVPKGRPRAFKAGNFIRMYTPEKTRKWEKAVKIQAFNHKPDKIYEGPIQVDMVFYLNRPKSLPKRVLTHHRKPDLDNLAKCILDALEGDFFKNDSQINRMSLQKEHADPVCGVDVMITYEVNG